MARFLRLTFRESTTNKVSFSTFNFVSVVWERRVNVLQFEMLASLSRKFPLFESTFPLNSPR